MFNVRAHRHLLSECCFSAGLAQVRAVGSGILSVLWRPASTCDFWLHGCIAFKCTGNFKNQSGLLSCFLLSSTTTCAYCLCAPAWGYFYMSFSFLFPHLCVREKHSIHSFIHSFHKLGMEVLPSHPASRPFPPTFPSMIRM